jgi:hypothetical protein
MPDYVAMHLSENLIDQGAGAQRIIAVDAAGNTGFVPAEAEFGTAYAILANSVTLNGGVYLEMFPVRAPGAGIRILTLTNTDTTGIMYVTVTGGLPIALIQMPGTSKSYDLAAVGLNVSAAVSLRRVGSGAAGSFLAEAIY